MPSSPHTYSGRPFDPIDPSARRLAECFAAGPRGFLPRICRAARPTSASARPRPKSRPITRTEMKSNAGGAGRGGLRRDDNSVPSLPSLAAGLLSLNGSENEFGLRLCPALRGLVQAWSRSRAGIVRRPEKKVAADSDLPSQAVGCRAAGECISAEHRALGRGGNHSCN